MKRSFMLLLLPALSACSIENDYYTNDYRYYPGVNARVEKTYPSAHRHYEASRDNYHGHSDTRSRYHGHEEGRGAANHETRRQHAHPSRNVPRVHGHYSEETVETQSAVNNTKNRVHGHE